MTAVVEDYLESPMDTDDVFPCKGCGEILEEGKAFELAGNRWHLNCFRCNTCGTLLDSDANLLLLGDGSLICNNCTYSCSACNNKIEDLAILTGDQAFCATCFRCRNCKRKIENLRYARTSQGIFCMSCHESLMARRRKKSKAAAQAKSREKDGSPMITDKSLPALPPNAIPPNAFSDTRVDPDSDKETPTELSPRPRPAYSRNDSSSKNSSRPSRSPERASEHRESGLNLPASNYRNNRNSAMFAPSINNSNNGDTNGGEDSFFIPVALDQNPALSATPRSTSESVASASKKQDKDYFNSVPRASTDKKGETQSSTPHIAFQEKGRQPSSDYESGPVKLPLRKASKSSRNDTRSSTSNDEKTQKVTAGKLSPAIDDFKLQDAPKSKKLVSPRRASHPAIITPESGSAKSSEGVLRKDKEPFPNLQSSESPPRMSTTTRSSQDSRQRDEGDVRPSMDSVSSSRTDVTAKSIPRKELPPTSRNANDKPVGGTLGRSATHDETSSSGLSASARSNMAEHKLTDTYMQPRAPPQPPGVPANTHKPPTKDQANANSEEKVSPKLPRWSAGGDFSMDEDMARILGTDEGSSSILRRVSNAVRHGRTNSTESSHPQLPQHPHKITGHTRSISETTRGTASPRWPKTPIVEDPNGHEISSPISLHSSDDPAFLKRQLRNSENRVAELERQFTTEKDLKRLNKTLIEKRKTVSVLDTQTEIMIRQLEVLAGYVERAKETKTPVDPRDLEDSAIKEFVQKLDKVKQTMSAAIEQLHAERDELIDEKNQAMADRDRALLEFEQLSSKNAQLADMNNDLTHQIQERFKSQIGGELKSPNGLGIYSQSKVFSSSNLNLADSASMTTTLVHEAEEPVVEARPTVVDIRKGQVKKFNWKKGSKGLAQNVAKGVNRAVVAFQNDRERGGVHQQQGLTGDNIGLPYNMTVSQVEAPATQLPATTQKGAQQAADRQGFGFFKKTNAAKSTSTTNLSTPAIAEAPSTLFGSDLVERADFERRTIPSVVTRCIEEVELRGMDIEGIYRKTGGNSQVKMIQEGFDKSEDYDISDPGLDITAVTSVLKQYFRKLPSPLLTYDVYDKVLESNAITDPTERCDHLRKVFSTMPQRHRDCLEFLMFHLARVAQRESENLMSPKNLAVVFAPTIMRDTSLEREMTDMHAKNLAVQFVIENSHTIFTD
ncbi:putative Rho-type GTPase-activating protein 4 [Colletotrichum chlorophyti]|uniref:Putative Rho-type GTPase-activating protein 4 n=1 Tax=Colletotrichum chlorophyti TaxID=708187 RepID=A0A1Q8S762_9PEZI|nr:putative Rho-type GTPase-activating protein 4 [Colletotrichum chlorophyti]